MTNADISFYLEAPLFLKAEIRPSPQGCVGVRWAAAVAAGGVFYLSRSTVKPAGNNFSMPVLPHSHSLSVSLDHCSLSQTKGNFFAVSLKLRPRHKFSGTFQADRAGV